MSELAEIYGTYFFGALLDVQGVPVPLFTRSITINEDSAKSFVAVNGNFWGSLVSSNEGPGSWVFSDNGRDFICVAPFSPPLESESAYITITYLQYPPGMEGDLPGDPSVTGVWLGTSNPPSPSPFPPPHRRDRDS